MDPISIGGLALSLSIFCGKAVIGINSVKDKWGDSSLSLASLAAECATLGAALSVLEGMLSQQTWKHPPDEHGSVAEILQGSIRACFMTMSELNDEIAEIQRHTSEDGTLRSRGKTSYVLNEGRIIQLTDLLRGQSGVLNVLQTSLQRKTLVEMEKMMRGHCQEARRVYAQSEGSWLKRNASSRVPRTLREAESILNADVATIASSAEFAFDHVAVNSTAYRNAMNRALRVRDPERPPDLFEAVKSMNTDTVSLLLQQGEDPNQTDKAGMTPLQRCAPLVGPQAPRLVSTLVMHGADVDAHRLGTGLTPLRLAAKSGNLAVVKALIGLGADPQVSDRLSAQAIHAAVQFGHCDIVEYLIRETSSVEGGSGGVQVVASMFDDKDMVRDSDCTLLHFAAAGEHSGKEMADFLVRMGLDPVQKSARGRTPLRYAISRKKAAVVNQLVSHGCDLIPDILRLAEVDELDEDLWGPAGSLRLDTPNLHGRTAASMAAEQGLTKSLEHLLNKAASPIQKDSSGRSPLMWAAHLANDEGTKLCVNSKSAVSAAGAVELLNALVISDIPTAFLGPFTVILADALRRHLSDQTLRRSVSEFALKADLPGMMELLLLSGDAEDSKIRVLAQVAADRQSHKVLNHLLDRVSVGVDDANAKLSTQLLWVVTAGLTDVAEYLLQRGANPLGHDWQRKQPLAAAAFSGHEKLTKMFLDLTTEILDDHDTPVGNSTTPMIYLMAQGIIIQLVRGGHIHLLKLLPWERMAQVNFVDMDSGLPPLFIVAATTGEQAMAKEMLLTGFVDINQRFSWNPTTHLSACRIQEDTALHLACRRGLSGLVDLFLRNGASVKAVATACCPGERCSRHQFCNLELTPLAAALLERPPNLAEIISMLLDHGAEVSEAPVVTLTSIGALAKKNRVDLPASAARSFLHLPSWGRKAETPVSLTVLMLACQIGEPIVLSILLARGGKQSASASSLGPLHMAVLARNVTIIDILLSHGGHFDVDSDIKSFALEDDGFSPVSLAALSGFLPGLELLVGRANATINTDWSGDIGDARNTTTSFPLRLAAYWGHVQVVKYLLQQGARLVPGDPALGVTGEKTEVRAILEEEIARQSPRLQLREIPPPLPPRPPAITLRKKAIGQKISDFFRRDKPKLGLPVEPVEKESQSVITAEEYLKFQRDSLYRYC
ncbi:ankyrin repeat-containing domain protein [Podospora didyma]|uniref:Ankyrin repeat-containing domain protein n=1 Tax=Podospora didyma TaxID=330526 RepID=A0AAE0NR42_9PEZI|nr:ankyrin repeat-containing domain protein [Podospora didyma]